MKRGARPNIQGAYEQANTETDGRPPLVISRKDRSVWLATMTLDRFIHLIRIIQEYQKALDPEFHIVRAESDRPASNDNPRPSTPEALDDEPT